LRTAVDGAGVGGQRLKINTGDLWTRETQRVPAPATRAARQSRQVVVARRDSAYD